MVNVKAIIAPVSSSPSNPRNPESTMNLTDQVRAEPAVRYRSKRLPLDEEEAIIRQAMAILARRMKRPSSSALTSPDDARAYLHLRLENLEHEVFGVVWLDNRHRALAVEELFHGTVDGASVHPREVVKQALRRNAAAAIFYHNHPSGIAEPSQSDLRITQRCKDALALVEVRVIDHLIIGNQETTSFAERNIL